MSSAFAGVANFEDQWKKLQSTRLNSIEKHSESIIDEKLIDWPLRLYSAVDICG